ncbi:GAF domain-containing SpoIIE family protein phosphatase [Streptomyces sp. SID3343]|uniref:PP2C family protein-serine/threonine phosphatase n=1 Tax=Streptomyces sp. SID3343 TaxID=2690260 RepID=UPI001F25612A|nr:GAF domain-containing SpoIIE family protein phosphatase [Streptomyces sp. SID3343]
MTLDMPTVCDATAAHVGSGPRQVDVPPEVFAPHRVAAVRATGLLDTAPEDGFDDLARLAVVVGGGQRAFITLVDDHRSFWKSAVGPGGPAADCIRQNAVPDCPCQILVATDRPLIVDDALAPESPIRRLKAVDALGIGAWVGFPIHGPGGEVLGGLSVIDERPHTWTADEVQGLATLSRSVSTEIGLRQALSQATARVRTLQDSLLPPGLPAVPGIEAAAAYLPAGGADVLGDFYDLFRLRGEHWAAVLGDVCGKGVEAATVTALARYTLRAEAARSLSPAAVLKRLHLALLDRQDSEEQRFLTAIHATFRPTATGLAGRLCTAGHPPALIRRADGRTQEVGVAGTLLGAIADVRLTEARFRLNAGDTLLMYTDGIIEAHSHTPGRGPRGPLFGERRLHEVLAACHGLDAQATIDRVAAATLAHTGGPAGDDTALLALRVPPRAATVTPTPLS